MHASALGGLTECVWSVKQSLLTTKTDTEETDDTAANTELTPENEFILYTNISENEVNKIPKLTLPHYSFHTKNSS